ncbi:MAG: N-acetylmuramoyl-L-alanine amidase [Panacagrimonas sp.]
MARCPFADWHPISGSSGPHLGGPYKIVHHTTEGSTAEGALNAFKKNRSDPHFTVDATRILQHVDTAEGARALRNAPGGVQTNRDGAVQIELVGFAHLPKDPRALTLLARLCRWIEATHGVPNVWPAGHPRPAKNGKDPGGHNRDAITWETKGGHYGHCHVPENTHWDPAYSEKEVSFIENAVFDEQGRLISSTAPQATTKGTAKAQRAKAPASRKANSTMPGHAIVPTGLSAYVHELPLAQSSPFATEERTSSRRRAPAEALNGPAVIDVGSLLSFVDGVSAQEKDDVLYSAQLAQRGASGAFDRFTQTQAWYGKYIEILGNLGWASEQFAFSLFNQGDGEFRMDAAALAIITAIATQNQLGVLKASVDALSKLKEGDEAITLFDFHSSSEDSGNFQLGSVQRGANGALTMALGAFYFRSVDKRKRFLFFKWGSQKLHFWTAAQRMTLNADFYARRRGDVLDRLEADAGKYIANIKLG